MSPQSRTPPVRVVCAVILRRGRVLAARRKPGGAHPPLFEFPGGKIKAGETPFEAIRREIIEELGLTLRPLRVGPAVRHRYPERCVELIPVLCDRPRGCLRLCDHSEVQWILPAQWESVEWLEADRKLIRKIDLLNFISARATRAPCRKKIQSPAKSARPQKPRSPENRVRQK